MSTKKIIPTFKFLKQMLQKFLSIYDHFVILYAFQGQNGTSQLLYEIMSLVYQTVSKYSKVYSCVPTFKRKN